MAGVDVVVEVMVAEDAGGEAVDVDVDVDVEGEVGWSPLTPSLATKAESSIDLMAEAVEEDGESGGSEGACERSGSDGSASVSP